MPFQHACFISYRHGQQQLMKRFVEDFYEALSSELEPLIDPLRVYRDVLRLQGGDFYNQALARSLCESVCMIMIFTPTYFSSDHTYCTREFAAMRRIEESRLQPNAEHGLVIPVVLRGFDQLPEEVKFRRQVYKFDQFLMSDEKLARNRKFNLEIRKMAEYIAARCRELDRLAIDCGDFAMPGDDEVVTLLARVAGCPALFPGREVPNA